MRRCLFGSVMNFNKLYKLLNNAQKIKENFSKIKDKALTFINCN